MQNLQRIFTVTSEMSKLRIYSYHNDNVLACNHTYLKRALYNQSLIEIFRFRLVSFFVKASGRYKVFFVNVKRTKESGEKSFTSVSHFNAQQRRNQIDPIHWSDNWSQLLLVLPNLFLLTILVWRKYIVIVMFGSGANQLCGQVQKNGELEEGGRNCFQH